MKIWAIIKNNEVVYFNKYQAATEDEPENTHTNGAVLYNISDEYEKFASRYKKYSLEGDKLVYNSQKLSLDELKNELEEIKNWFFENDWKVNKVFIGEWEATDPRWVEYKQQRAVKRTRLDKIKEALGI